MLKLLIVDDEPLVLNGLSQYDWNSCGFELMGTAKNGLYAIEFLEDHTPDAILSDIRMPKMNGVKFIEKVMVLLPDIEFVFLTGFNDFAYTKEAIKLGAYDYLLKPVDFDELEKVMLGLKQKILDKKKEKEAFIHLLEKEQELNYLKNIDHLFPALWSDPQSISKFQSDFKFSSTDRIVLIGSDLVRQSSEKNWKDTQFILLKELQEQFKREDIRIMQKELEELNYSFVILNSIKGDAVLVQEIERCCQEANKFLKTKLGVSVKFAISEFHSNVNEIETLKVQVDTLLTASKFSTDHPVLSFSKYTEKKYDLWIFLDDFQMNIFETMLSGNVNQTKNIIESWLKMIPETAKIDFVKFRFNGFLLEYMQFFNDRKARLPKTQQLASHLYPCIIRIIEKVNSAETLSEVRKSIKENILLLTNIGNGNNKGKTKKEKLVEQILMIIETDYADDIALEDLSDKYNVSKPYISKIIKEKTGRSFMDILNSTRLTVATDLLKEHGLKIKDISKMVGFMDDSYFIKVFRKEYGMTPSDYRRIM
ncbi:response regulator [Lederbergia sp. NSJ-179]|uniref:response regulator n=1 Tax=Lederbergia sp. NSJ-179 TaxID=2931402 RepID=UPI001FD283E0|nr:response regulator [Lederbergia sp. NSJ-179]MCJ7842133.1 response regulator [Lederbergia sp. NSJ-179]